MIAEQGAEDVSSCDVSAAGTEASPQQDSAANMKAVQKHQVRGRGSSSHPSSEGKYSTTPAVGAWLFFFFFIFLFFLAENTITKVLKMCYVCVFHAIFSQYFCPHRDLPRCTLQAAAAVNYWLPGGTAQTDPFLTVSSQMLTYQQAHVLEGLQTTFLLATLY